MKQYQILLPFIIIGLVSCQNEKNFALINGHVNGKHIDSLEYSVITEKGQYIGFKEGIHVDSIGNFLIETHVPDNISFLTILCDRKEGILVVENGQTYDVEINLLETGKAFIIHGANEEGQNLYNELPNPSFINLVKLISEFDADTSAFQILQDINNRKTLEISHFKALLKKNKISSTFYDFIMKDRDCYYSSLTSSIALSRLYDLFPNNISDFSDEIYNMWKDVYLEYPPTTEQFVKTRWWLEYVENYIKFNEYTQDNFCADTLMVMYNENRIHTHNIDEAKKSLSGDLLKYYSAYYLFINAYRQRNEKELVLLFDEFNDEFPNNKYSSFIEPFIEPVREFHEEIENKGRQNIVFVENYSQINTLDECLEKFKGKPLFIDVWATWCSPCLKEFREKEKLHSLLEDNKYELVYISIDKDRNDMRWKTLISEYNLYKGYHLRANANLSNDLIEVFGNDKTITIPWYMIINKDGEISVKHAAKPSDIKTLEKQLRKARG